VLEVEVRDCAIALRTPHQNLPQLSMFPLLIYREDKTNSVNCPIIYSLEFIKRYNLALKGRCGGVFALVCAEQRHTLLDRMWWLENWVVFEMLKDVTVRGGLP
jgi:hypothetical protein